MLKTGHFRLKELGTRLRELRVRSLLSRAELAERIGLNQLAVWRLETGRTKGPSLDLVGSFLRACAASWSEVIDVLDRVEPVEIDTRPIENAQLPEATRQRLLAATSRQVQKYQRSIERAAQARPARPEQRRVMAERLRNYRIVANLIEQAVGELLSRSRITSIDLPAYKGVARGVLSVLWRARAANPGAEELSSRVTAKQEKWRRENLDMELVGEIEEIVIEQFARLRQQHPELLEVARAANTRGQH